MRRGKSFVFLILAGIVAISHAYTAGEQKCETSTGFSGTCVNIYNCPPLIRLLTKYPLEEPDINYLRSNRCGTEGKTPKVCCVPEISAVGPVQYKARRQTTVAIPQKKN